LITPGVLIVFAKEPRPGLVKTRLCPPLTPVEAAALYRCMLDDVLETSGATCAELGIEAWIALHPPDACAALAPRFPKHFRVIAQRGPDLASRMQAAIAAAAAAGHQRILLRGSDSPELAGAVIGEALAALDSSPVVVVPGDDGGYDLIGVREPVEALFEVAMSTEQVMADTLSRAATAGLSVKRLARSADLDTAEDLARLRSASDPLLRARCRRTLTWMARHPQFGSSER
jgi:rSAM/selenodomain-associated transferase 1